MKNILFSSMLLALAIFFTGCSSCCAQGAEKEKGKDPAPEAILIIDDVAYYDGCNGCDCVEEAVCVCEAKSDCACCRKHLKKAPKEMQKKCKEMKKAHCEKKVVCIQTQEKDKGKDSACNSSGKEMPKDPAGK